MSFHSKSLRPIEFYMSVVMSLQIFETMESVSSSLEKDDVDAIFGNSAFDARPAVRTTKTLPRQK